MNRYERSYAEAMRRAGGQLDTEIKALLLAGVVKTYAEGAKLLRDCRPELWKDNLHPHLTPIKTSTTYAKDAEARKEAADRISDLARQYCERDNIDFATALTKVQLHHKADWKEYMSI